MILFCLNNIELFLSLSLLNFSNFPPNLTGGVGDQDHSRALFSIPLFIWLCLSLDLEKSKFFRLGYPKRSSLGILHRMMRDLKYPKRLSSDILYHVTRFFSYPFFWNFISLYRISSSLLLMIENDPFHVKLRPFDAVCICFSFANKLTVKLTFSLAKGRKGTSYLILLFC